VKGPPGHRGGEKRTRTLGAKFSVSSRRDEEREGQGRLQMSKAIRDEGRPRVTEQTPKILMRRPYLAASAKERDSRQTTSTTRQQGYEKRNWKKRQKINSSSAQSPSIFGDFRIQKDQLHRVLSRTCPESMHRGGRGNRS